MQRKTASLLAVTGGALLALGAGYYLHRRRREAALRELEQERARARSAAIDRTWTMTKKAIQMDYGYVDALTDILWWSWHSATSPPSSDETSP